MFIIFSTWFIFMYITEKYYEYKGIYRKGSKGSW